MDTIEATNIAGLRARFLAPRHGVLNFMHLMRIHAALVLWFWLAFAYLPYGIAICFSVVASFLHQRALSEWIHEGAHFNFMRGRRRNDLALNLLAGPLFGYNLDQYRKLHFGHHAMLRFFVSEDPDTGYMIAASTRMVLWECIKDLTGVRAVKGYLFVVFAGAGRKRSVRQGAPQTSWYGFLLCFHATLVGLLYLVSRLDSYIVYYVTLLTIYQAFSRLRSYGQHAWLDDGKISYSDSAASRTVDAGWLDRLFFTSRVMMYHHEHHRYPHLPYRALRAISKPSRNENVYTTSRLVTIFGR